MIVSNPKRPLDRGVEMSRFEVFCRKVAPYVLFFSIMLFGVLIFIALAKYGGAWFSTPQNKYEHLNQIVGCIL